MCGVSNRTPRRAQPDADVEPKDRSDSTDHVDRQAWRPSALDATDGLMRVTNMSSQLALAESGRKPGLADLLADPSNEVASESAASLLNRFPRRHAADHAGRPLAQHFVRLTSRSSEIGPGSGPSDG